jgi:hypothetical protein
MMLFGVSAVAMCIVLARPLKGCTVPTILPLASMAQTHDSSKETLIPAYFFGLPADALILHAATVSRLLLTMAPSNSDAAMPTGRASRAVAMLPNACMNSAFTAAGAVAPC